MLQCLHIKTLFKIMNSRQGSSFTHIQKSRCEIHQELWALKLPLRVWLRARKINTMWIISWTSRINFSIVYTDIKWNIWIFYFIYLDSKWGKENKLLDSALLTYNSLIHLFRSAGRVFSSSDWRESKSDWSADICWTNACADMYVGTVAWTSTERIKPH